MGGIGLREERKRETHDAIETAAWRLFARRGFDQTTVEEIAEAADVAPRTFFRYFETKDAVLYGDWREKLTAFCDQLRARPTAEPPLVALNACVGELIDSLEADTTELLQRARIMSSTTQFASYRYNVVQPAWITAIAAVLADRLAVDAETDVRPRLFAAIVTVALDTARDVWVASGGRGSIVDVVEQTFGELGASINAEGPIGTRATAGPRPIAPTTGRRQV